MAMLEAIDAMLQNFIDRTSFGCIREPTPFDSTELQKMSILAFLQHIKSSHLCSDEVYVIAVVLLERIMLRHPQFVISRENVHLMLLIAIMVSSKVLDDFYCRNQYYALAGGIGKDRLNEMELRLCFMLDFDLAVTPEEFALYREQLWRVQLIYCLPPLLPSRTLGSWNPVSLAEPGFAAGALATPPVSPGWPRSSSDGTVSAAPTGYDTTSTPYLISPELPPSSDLFGNGGTWTPMGGELPGSADGWYGGATV